MSGLDRWRILDQLTIYQVALLIEGYDPAGFADVAYSRWNSSVRNKIAPVLTALRHAVEDGSLPLHKVCEGDFGERDLQSSLVHVDKIREWLVGKRIHAGIFAAPALQAQLDNSFGRYYAPKLAAANAAWKAVTSDQKRLRGKSPKQALVLWLTEHAADYDLQNKDGTPNATGIEEVAKVANWQSAGGAPATPKPEEKLGVGSDGTKGMAQQNRGAGSPDFGLDDEIPL